MPTTRRRVRTHRSAFAKPTAKSYVDEVEKIRIVLNQKRKDYKEAAAQEKKAKTKQNTNPARSSSVCRTSKQKPIKDIKAIKSRNYLETLISNNAPIVSIHDASSHAMAWLGSALGVRQISLGVNVFGQSGTIPDLYKANLLDTDSIFKAATHAIGISRNK